MLKVLKLNNDLKVTISLVSQWCKCSEGAHRRNRATSVCTIDQHSKDINVYFLELDNRHD